MSEVQTTKICNQEDTAMKQGVPATETATELAQRFAELVLRWKKERRHTSLMKIMKECAAYREIVAMGEKVIPLLLVDLEKEDSFAFLALKEITVANPVPKESVGKIDEIAAAWLAWGKAQGYRWEHAL